MFYGRKEELRKLARFFANDISMLSLIYGRRRIGKSELIKQALRQSDIDYIYYECKQTTEMNNVESLAALISDKYSYPRLAFQSMEEVLEFIVQKHKNTKFVLVLDEYNYLKDTVKGLDSILQGIVDRYKENSGIKFIICGSVVDTMKSVLLKENPLYGRVDLAIDLKPMDYYDSALFYNEFSDEDKVRLYSVFGGVPYYNRLIDSELSVKENIIELIASPGARLENEVSMYLKSEISKINNANEVFETIAKGYHKYTDILSQSHVSSGPTLVDVLDKLMRMDVVAKEAPINDLANKRKSSYYISDNLSLFYYCYVYRYSSQMNVMEPEAFYNRYIDKNFEEEYVPKIFENICKQYLIRKNRKGLLEEPFELIGKYYYNDPKAKKNGEFDVVTKDARGYIFYEAKFRKSPMTRAMIDIEVKQVKETGLACYKYGFFSRSGFDAVPTETEMFFKLQELYGNL